MEVKSYLAPFDPLKSPLYWFKDVYPTNTWTKPHEHEWGEFAYTSSGCMVMCSGNGNWLAQPGRAVWIPAGHRHEWYAPCKSSDCSLWIAQSRFAGIERFSRCHVMKITPLIHEILVHLSMQSRQDGGEARERLIMVLLDLLLNLAEVANPISMPKSRPLVELCASLLAMPGNAATLKEWAKNLGMSERNLSRLFHMETGVSFGVWRSSSACRQPMTD